MDMGMGAAAGIGMNERKMEEKSELILKSRK